MKQLRRVSPRVPYDEPVCLTRVDGGGRLYGRSVNLSVAGIYVQCVEPCEIGTELVCSVLLPGGPRKLRGRVMRLTALHRSVGVAIAFCQPTARDQAIIEQLVARHQREIFQARLRLDGMNRSVRCQAVMEDGTLHLSTTLPFLRLDADADVGVWLGDGEEVQAQGVISKIALDPAGEDGVPRLALDIELAGPTAGDAGGIPRLRGPQSDEVDAQQAPLPTSPVPWGQDVPSVVISTAMEHEVVARALLNGPPRRRARGTAEIARRPRFTDWTLPPAVKPRSASTSAPAPAPSAPAPSARAQAFIAAAPPPARGPAARWQRRARRWLRQARWQAGTLIPLALAAAALTGLLARAAI